MVLRLSAVLTLSALVAAQEATLPERSYFHHGSATTAVWRSTAMHFQVIYDSTHLVTQGVTGPISIFRLRFRAGDGVLSSGGATYALANVQLSSCPVNYASATTTFANNRGADNQLCYSGPITTLPTAGGAPNDAFVDLVLANPFTYDPTLGLDLVIEVDSAAPSGTVPSTAVTSLRCRRISAATPTAATGTSNGSAACVLVDFVGPGGYGTWNEATAVSNGVGCYKVATSFYEEFTDLSQFDLSNTTLTLTPNGGGGYSVTAGPATPFFPHGATHLGLTDDDIAVVNVPPGFGTGFPFPTGNQTSTLTICSNGFVYLGTELLADFPDVEVMLLWPTGRLAPFFADLLPDATNNVHYDIDPSGQAVYVTWNAVPSFSFGGVADVQLVMHSNGVVEYRYGSCVGAALDLGIVGWTPGNLAADPGNFDLSVAPPFATSGPDQQSLQLFSGNPYIGATLAETVAFVPTTATFTIRILAALPLPGIDLGIIGAPGCPMWVDLGSAIDIGASVLNPQADFAIPIPNLVGLMGFNAYTQAASFVPGANPFGVQTSNQTTLTFGNS